MGQLEKQELTWSTERRETTLCSLISSFKRQLCHVLLILQRVHNTITLYGYMLPFPKCKKQR